jgi:hypothetical protein
MEIQPEVPFTRKRIALYTNHRAARNKFSFLKNFFIFAIAASID